VSFGIAILGSVLNSVDRSNLNGHLSGLNAQAQEIARGNVAGAVAVAHHLTGTESGPLLRAAHDAYASGM
jgi:MFS transporter, DHA2 family, multidrug resistance protein